MKIHCNYNELINPKKLKPNPKNPNSHDKDQIDRLCEILTYQGWRYPIKVSNQSGFITSGHGRLASALKLNLKEVPVSYQDYEDEDQEYADLVADNAIASWSNLDLSQINIHVPELSPDFNIDHLGIKNFTIDMSDKGLCDEDEIPETVVPISKRGDLYQLGSHRLLCGDSTDVADIGKLINEKVKLCFTSPPYSDMRDYNGQLELDPKHLAKFLMAPCDLFIVNLGLKRTNGKVDWYWKDYIDVASEIGLSFISWNVWDKGEAGSIGNQTAIFPLEHEFIFVFGEKIDLNKTIPCKHAGIHKSSLRGSREKDGRLNYKENNAVVSNMKKMGSVFRAPPEKARNLGHDHPAVFPVYFPEAFILSCTDKEDKVYEPFGGSGSTLIACEKTNRKCFMMEIDPHYCDVIVTRWEKYTGQTAQLSRNESLNA